MGVIRTGQTEQHELRVKKRCRPACTSTQSVRFLNEYCQCLLIADSNVSDQTVLISRFIRLCCALWLSIALVRYQCKTRCVWYSYSLHFAFGNQLSLFLFLTNAGCFCGISLPYSLAVYVQSAFVSTALAALLYWLAGGNSAILTTSCRPVVYQLKKYIDY